VLIPERSTALTSNEIVLIVAATRAALIFDPALVVKLVHIVYAATEPTGRNLYFDDIIMTHHLPKASSAFVAGSLSAFRRQR
jgi:hypothetical protein